jgi:hypothetical protein
VAAVTEDRRLLINDVRCAFHTVDLKIPVQLISGKLVICGGFGFVVVIAGTEEISLISVFTINGLKATEGKIGTVVAVEAGMDGADNDFLLIAEYPGKGRLWNVPGLRPLREILDVELIVSCLYSAMTTQKLVIGT